MKKLSLIFVLALLFNCSSGSDDGPTDPPTPQPPSAATLTFPENNQECNQGTSINSTQSSVTFTWQAATNATSYDVVLKNLDSDVTVTLGADTNQKEIILDKATPYSWYVVSKATGTTETATSDTWKFYNAGDGITSYAPFPATLVAPTMGANLTGVTSVTLEWTGSDVDDDIAHYDVYFDTVSPPTAQISDDQTATTANATVAAGNVYYWRVITTDAEGNNSQSEIFEFRVD